MTPIGRRNSGDADETARRLAEMDARLARLEEAVAEDARRGEARHRDLQDILAAIRGNEAANRERLYALRLTPQYRAAFDDPDPLVSVLIPTYDRVEELLERSLPSVFAQTHSNLEVLVVTDGSPPHVAEALATVDDPRLRCIHLLTRGPYPDDPEQTWHIKGSPGANAGLLSARGAWISPFADDDVLRPHAIEQVLSHVRTHGLELCYGKFEWHQWDGSVRTLGDFPPRPAGQALQGALLHAGLTFIQHELSDAQLRVPNDWSMIDRMMRLGVRIGFIDEVLSEWHQGPHPDEDEHLNPPA